MYNIKLKVQECVDKYTYICIIILKQKQYIIYILTVQIYIQYSTMQSNYMSLSIARWSDICDINYW